jgi:hypothetical protein
MQDRSIYDKRAAVTVGAFSGRVERRGHDVKCFTAMPFSRETESLLRDVIDTIQLADARDLRQELREIFFVEGRHQH